MKLADNESGKVEVSAKKRRATNKKIKNKENENKDSIDEDGKNSDFESDDEVWNLQFMNIF